jgi:hypothetical protein
VYVAPFAVTATSPRGTILSLPSDWTRTAFVQKSRLSVGARRRPVRPDVRHDRGGRQPEPVARVREEIDHHVRGVGVHVRAHEAQPPDLEPDLRDAAVLVQEAIGRREVGGRLQRHVPEVGRQPRLIGRREDRVRDRDLLVVVRGPRLEEPIEVGRRDRGAVAIRLRELDDRRLAHRPQDVRALPGDALPGAVLIAPAGRGPVDGALVRDDRSHLSGTVDDRQGPALGDRQQRGDGSHQKPRIRLISRWRSAEAGAHANPPKLAMFEKRSRQVW